MEHLLGKMTVTSEGCPFTCPYYEGQEINYHKGMLPQTDDLLSRAINISIGVSDVGLGSAYGIKITSTKDEIERVGQNLVKSIKESL
jgi:8-amino-3,8-dideoxy-alpha-D-manno-octulosonate transaminase